MTDFLVFTEFAQARDVLLTGSLIQISTSNCTDVPNHWLQEWEMSMRNLELTKNWRRTHRTRKFELLSPIRMTLQCLAYAISRPPLLTSRTPFVCGLSLSCSPRSAPVSTCFSLYAVPVLSLLLLLLNFSHSPLARLGADGCLPGSGLCSDILSISTPAHSTSRSTRSLWYAFAS